MLPNPNILTEKENKLRGENERGDQQKDGSRNAKVTKSDRKKEDNGRSKNRKRTGSPWPVGYTAQMVIYGRTR